MEITDAQLSKLKEIELEMLDEFVRICNKHGIKYFLSGGTCLGAVRHKGFIPWDDDIDVGMLRDEYDRFAKICNDELGSDYVFQDMRTEPNCGLCFGKIRKKGTVYSESYSAHINMSQGIWIDIFPYDNVSNNPKERTRQIKRVSLLKNLYIVKCGYKYPEYKDNSLKAPYYAAQALCKMIPRKWIIEKLDEAMKKHQGDESCQYAIPFGGAYSVKKELEMLARLNSLSPIEFEGKNYLTFTDWNGYLSKHYGDYMQLPSKEKRRAGVHYISRIEM